MDHPQPQQLSADDFRERRRWTILPRNAQEDPAAYRQPKYHPQNQHDTIQTQFDAFVHRINTSLTQGSTDFAFARVVAYAWNKREYLINLVDRRNPLPTTDLQDAEDIDQVSQLNTWFHLERSIAYLQSHNLYTLRDHRRLLDRRNWEVWVDRSNLGHFVSHIDGNAQHGIRSVEIDHFTRYLSESGGPCDEFNWLPAFMDSLTDALFSCMAAVAWSQHSDGRNVKRALDSALGDIPQMTRLIAILLEREVQFEGLLMQEHIFNCLFDKRIVLLNGKAMAKIWDEFMALDLPPDPNLMAPIYAVDSDIERTLYPHLRNYQWRLNQLFDYRYIMDWSRNKMWDHLFVVIPPTYNVNDGTMQKFLGWSNSNGFLAQNVFRVHPATFDEFQDRECSICLGVFNEEHHETGVVSMRTKCNHYYHPRCIFLSWDTYNFWQNRCPMCRASAGRLRDALAGDLSDSNIDYEHEVTNPLLDAQWKDQIFHLLENGNDNLEAIAPHILNAYFLDIVRHFVRTPARDIREQNQPLWRELGEGNT